MYYLNNFFLYSILGHILESFFYKNGDSGILAGIWTPVYGIGVVIIIFSYNFFKKHFKTNKILEIIYVFLIGSILLSTIEYIGGILIEIIFDRVFWDYSHFKFNIGKYAALEMSFIWGISALILIYLLKNITDKIIKKIPKLLTLVLLILILFDLYYSILLK